MELSRIFLTTQSPQLPQCSEVSLIRQSAGLRPSIRTDNPQSRPTFPIAAASVKAPKTAIIPSPAVPLVVPWINAERPGSFRPLGLGPPLRVCAESPKLTCSRRSSVRTFLCENDQMKAAEFKRKVERLAKTRNVVCRWDPKHGKGSHGRLTYSGKSTTLKDLKKEIGIGLLKRCVPSLESRRRLG